MEQAPLGTSFLILVDRLVRLLRNIRTSSIRTITAFAEATVAQPFKTVDFVNMRKVASIMILIETNNVLRRQELMAAIWKIECLLSEVRPKIQCLVMQNQQELMINYQEGVRHEKTEKYSKHKPLMQYKLNYGVDSDADGTCQEWKNLSYPNLIAQKKLLSTTNLDLVWKRCN